MRAQRAGFETIEPLVHQARIERSEPKTLQVVRSPELRSGWTSGRGFWSNLWDNTMGRVLQIQGIRRLQIPAAACAVLMGLAALGGPTQAYAQSRAFAPTPAITMSVAGDVQNVAQKDPTQLTAPLVRNSEVDDVRETIASRARMGHASSTHFLPGNDLKFESWNFSYETGKARRMNILEAPADGMVRGTIVVNVSGHSGEAAAFATSNTYTVEITLPDGTQLTRTAIPRNVVADPTKPGDTPEYATVIDIEYPYQSGITKVGASPDGSGGAGGYIEGRLYYVHSHDQKWDVSEGWKWSREHKAAHPEVRWGTQYEREDREEHHVSPDPRPYASYRN